MLASMDLKKKSRVCFTDFKTAFPFSIAILICKYIISAETSVFIRVGSLAEGLKALEKAVWTSIKAVIRYCSVLLATLQCVFLYSSEASKSQRTQFSQIYLFYKCRHNISLKCIHFGHSIMFPIQN